MTKYPVCGGAGPSAGVPTAGPALMPTHGLVGRAPLPDHSLRVSHVLVVKQNQAGSAGTHPRVHRSPAGSLPMWAPDVGVAPRAGR